MDNIILVGGGGHCRSCIDVINACGRFKITGIIDRPERLHESVLGYKIMADESGLKTLVGDDNLFMITIGQLKDPSKRKSKFELLKGMGARLAVVVSPSAYVSRSAFVGDGTIIMHNAFVNVGAKIGENCIINTGAVIEHDVEILDNCHISTKSVINGGCVVGEGTFIGSGSVISNNLEISDNAVIGAGSVIIRSIKESGTYAGVPARRIA